MDIIHVTPEILNLMSSVDEYNLQKAKIDANAFAVLIMLSFFKIQPQYQGLSDNVKQKNSQKN